MNFYQKYKNESDNIVCLTIAWNSGRIQHFPIIEKESVRTVNICTTPLSHSFSMRHDMYNFNLTVTY